jgi:Ion channel
MLFTLLYMGFDALRWGTVVSRSGTSETSFADLLYFSMGTFFRIGYGDQVPVGWCRLLTACEAFANFAIGVMFMAHLVLGVQEQLIANRVRERLEGLQRPQR